MSGEEVEKMKLVGFKVSEEEYNKTILPVMHDCYGLGLCEQETVSSFVRFCINFWLAHYYNKKKEFEERAKDIEHEKRKLAAIVAEKEAWEKSTPGVVEKATKQLEQLGKDIDRDFEETHSRPPSSSSRVKKKTPLVANLSLEDMMA